MHFTDMIFLGADHADKVDPALFPWDGDFGKDNISKIAENTFITCMWKYDIAAERVTDNSFTLQKPFFKIIICIPQTDQLSTHMLKSIFSRGEMRAAYKGILG